MRVALVTACYGAYDPVRPLPADHGFDDAVLITDDPDLVTDSWRVVYEPRDEHPRLAAKRAKMMPWLYTDCDAAVWLDASFEVMGDMFYKWVVPQLAVNDFMVWSHPEGRYCIGQEAEVSMTLAKYQGSLIREQAESYFADGMPRDWGLFACGTVGYRFNPEVEALGEAWYGEQVKWSVQDQISLPYVLWNAGKRYGVWAGNEYQNPYVQLRWDQRPRPTE